MLGILGVIVIPRFTGIQKEARKKADVATARSLAKAAELAIIQEDENVNINDNNEMSISKLKEQGYIDIIPDPQSSNKSFVIIVESDNITVGIGTKNDMIELYPNTDDSYQ